MSQPRTGVNQKPLVFAQIRQGVSAPEISKARVVESSRVIDISSNRFLHLFYRKPYMSDMGYDHGLDGLATFRVKTGPDARKPERNAEMLAAGPLDVGNSKSVSLSERQFLTLSDCDSWEYKPSVKVADFFANSLGVPIECWTPCSRIQMGRELEEADLIKFELECGAGESQDCAMTAGELALALNNGDAGDFDPFDDLHGEVQLSVLFVNAHPDIQPLDFRLRMRIMRCECEPALYVHANSGKVHKVTDGSKMAAGDLSRLGVNQTCLAVTFNQSDNTTARTAMKYCLFPTPPLCAYDYDVEGGATVGTVRDGDYVETRTPVAAGTTTAKVDGLGMSNRLATADLWCTRAGMVIGISRANASGIPLFEDSDTNRDASGATFNSGNAEHAAYYNGAALVEGAQRQHWKDYCHYAGNNADSWGASDGETVALSQTDLVTVIVNNSDKKVVAAQKPLDMEFSGEQVFKLVVVGTSGTPTKGKIVDTSESGEEASKLPEALERL